MPLTLGNECAGIVERTGADVTRFKAGDKVYACLPLAKIGAFAEYVAEYGKERLMAALKRNEECGVLYHYDGQLTGDYDLFQRKEEIIAFLERGLRPDGEI